MSAPATHAHPTPMCEASHARLAQMGAIYICSIATGKKDCNNELYGQATCGRRVRGTVQCKMRCACLASQARTAATHVSLCTVSGVLITCCRQSYVTQATREKRVRETIQFATCVPCVNARTRGVSACHISSSPSHSSGALIGNRRASYVSQATRANGVRQDAPVYTTGCCRQCRWLWRAG